jgi:branched-chain amino acid transport system permease protein
MVQYIAVSLVVVVINAISALGLNVQLGYSGLVNLMSITCVAIGGYVTMVFVLPPSMAAGAFTSSSAYILGLNLPFIVGILAGTLVAGLFGFLVSAIALRRLRVYYFGILTFCMANVTWNFVGQFKPLFNGPDGLAGLSLPTGSLFGYDDFNLVWLGVCCAVLALVFVFVEYIRRRPFGRVLRAIREDQDAAKAFGRNVYALQVKAFVIGSAIGGLAGGLLVGFTGALDPGGWSAGETLVLLTALFLGGSGNNWGVVIGMLLTAGLITQGITFLPSFIVPEDRQADVQLVVYGLLLIIILRVRPRGLIPERPQRDNLPAEAVSAT